MLAEHILCFWLRTQPDVELALSPELSKTLKGIDILPALKNGISVKWPNFPWAEISTTLTVMDHSVPAG